MEAGDEQLMLAYQEGGAAAFEELYKRHKGALFRFVLRSVREHALAEELYQEIWMRVIEARERYHPSARGAGQNPAKFSTWLYTIAHNRIVDHWRKRAEPPADIAPLSRQAPAAAGAPRAEAEARSAERDDRLGSGHGRVETSHAQYVGFERETSTPQETVAIYYDSYRNLVARGVIREPVPPRFPQPQPRPFPGFVPDPPA